MNVITRKIVEPKATFDCLGLTVYLSSFLATRYEYEYKPPTEAMNMIYKGEERVAWGNTWEQHWTA